MSPDASLTLSSMTTPDQLDPDQLDPADHTPGAASALLAERWGDRMPAITDDVRTNTARVLDEARTLIDRSASAT